MAENEWLTKDFYQVLGVSQEADAAQITKAYRKLARQYHPDVNKSPDAEEKFKGISEAYDVLNDPQQRQKYDAIRKFGAGGARFTGGSGAGGFGGAGFADVFSSMFGGGRSSGGYASGNNQQMEDMLASMFGGGRHAGGYSFNSGQAYNPPTPERGKDINSVINLTLRQAVKGATVSLAVGGKKFKIHIPAGVHEGQKIRLSGRGREGKHGGSKGDMYLTIHVEPHDVWRLDADRIIGVLPVSIGQAVAGAKVKMKTLDSDDVTVKIPSGSSSGNLVNLGHFNTAGKRYEMFAELSIQVPKSPNSSLKKMARSFDDASAEFLTELEQRQSGES